MYPIINIYKPTKNAGPLDSRRTLLATAKAAATAGDQTCWALMQLVSGDTKRTLGDARDAFQQAKNKLEEVKLNA